MDKQAFYSNNYNVMCYLFFTIKWLLLDQNKLQQELAVNYTLRWEIFRL